MIRFTKPVDPVENMSAVEWKTYNELGKSSLFTNITGHPGWTACSQIVADRRKWALGLGLKEETLLNDVAQRMKTAIGLGIHNCPGQILARAETVALLEGLVKAVSRIEIGEPVWHINNIVRGLEKLPVRLHS